MPEPRGRQGSDLTETGLPDLVVDLQERTPSQPQLLDHVASVEQLDDAGAETDDHYEWQAAMAAADGLSMLHDALDDDGVLSPGCDDAILCEWHEDWVLFSGGSMELVSGKHRSAGVGAYTTVASLADKAGIAHLFNRWFSLGREPLCRVVTTGGVGAGPARQLQAASRRLQGLRAVDAELVVVDEEKDSLDQLRKAIANYDKRTKARWAGTDSLAGVSVLEQEAEVLDFLSALTIQVDAVNRHVVRDAAPSRYAKPVLERMGRDAAHAGAVWEAVLAVFRTRMQSHGETEKGDLPTVMQRDRTGGSDPDVQRRIARRLVTIKAIKAVIEATLVVPEAFRPIPRLAVASRLEAKMTAGGCSPNAVGRATALRVDYEEFWRALESGDPEARVARRRLENVLRRVGDLTMGDLEVSGTRLWRALERETLALQHSAQLPPGVDSDIALGGLCDLSNRCEIWFGPRFDVAAMLGGNGEVTQS
ncbi:hypothetical protein ACFQ68_16705 [Amycolatopsis japonica]|uniref:hypothetical protein n=1 Tax=Amycolatopsis japonica TaxID=208439 RepID=UPI00367019E0